MREQQGQATCSCVVSRRASEKVCARFECKCKRRSERTNKSRERAKVRARERSLCNARVLRAAVRAERAPHLGRVVVLDRVLTQELEVQLVVLLRQERAEE
eukprot:2582180-Pleurochrysis_carterae.AAC.1